MAWYIPSIRDFYYSTNNSRKLMIKRLFKFNYHNIRYGFSPHETWDLRSTFAKFLIPRLKYFKEHLHGHPGNITYDEWLIILDKIILAFELHQRLDNDDEFELSLIKNKEENIKINNQIQEGFNLFSEYYFNLWD